ncbi:hypothetical protein BBta_7384 [Bradyrhizobium sp. BTAi1]|nr:hypothetical protein BBta_7384 [Bradyrhizobium sp. BTAi1]
MCFLLSCDSCPLRRPRRRELVRRMASTYVRPSNVAMQHRGQGFHFAIRTFRSRPGRRFH